MKKRLFALCIAAALLAGGAFAENEIDMLAVDHRLYELGYRDSACNGILDEVTINALKNFQMANGLEVTGQADLDTVNLLLGETAVSAADYLNALAREYMEMPSLMNGAKGSEVSKLQKALKALGYFSGSSDGAYGAETEAAVCRFQLANGLRETGIADSAVFIRLYMGTPIAWEEFLEDSCAVAGDSGANVRTLQLWLKHKGYFKGECTGKYGEGTQQAVRRFQSDCDLETSGDADLDTCRALFANVTALLRDSYALRRGEAGAAVENMCRKLAELGYPAHEAFDMQTELALMQFQLVNKLDVTGIADEMTIAKLNSDGAIRVESYVIPGRVVPEDENLPARIARQASALLGQLSYLDTDFGFVQLVNLKCGVALIDRAQLARVELGAADSFEAGALLGVQVDGKEMIGIASSNRAVIYRAESGYIVMSYLDAMEVENICLYRIVEEG